MLRTLSRLSCFSCFQTTYEELKLCMTRWAKGDIWLPDYL